MLADLDAIDKLKHKRLIMKKNNLEDTRRKTILKTQEEKPIIPFIMIGFNH